MEEQRSYQAVLKNRGFANLWVNQVLVQFAYNSLNFALIIWVFYLTQSNTAVATLLLAVYSPSLLFGLYSGVLVDMIDRKKIILFLDLLLAILVLSLVFFKGSFIFVLLITFVINSLVQFYISAESSALPIIVDVKKLFAANSLFSTTYFSMFLIGFGFSGPIISSLGIDSIFLIGGVALFTAFLLANKFPSITTKMDNKALRLRDALKNIRVERALDVATSEVKKTVGMIRGKLPVLSSIFILASMQAVVGAMAVLMPSFLEKTLQISATDASYIVVLPLGLGMVLGALLIGKIGYIFPRRVLVGRGVLIAGIMILLVGIAPFILPAIQHFPKPKAVSFLLQPPQSAVMSLGSILLGIIVVSVIIPSQTVLQENTPKQDRGKVFGVLVALMAGFTLPPVIFTGILSDIFGPTPIFILIGGVVAILGLLILKPDFFFEENHLPFRVREFLGLGHWRRDVS